jgi:hypothetical protein
VGTRDRRWTVVWRDNVKPADFAEWEAIVADALEPYPGEFGVGFYETTDGWTFTTGWRDVVGREDGRRARERRSGRDPAPDPPGAHPGGQAAGRGRAPPRARSRRAGGLRRRGAG